MKITSLIFLTFIIFITGCQQVTVEADSAPTLPQISGLKDPLKVSLCELKKNPSAYNHQLIEVTGFVSQGMEDFSISDPACDSSQCIWLEYGGTASSGTKYCCGTTPERSRPEPLVIEDIPISLVTDEKFKTFDRIKDGAVTHATIQGRFFSGRLKNLGEIKLYEGFGHFEMCSLLAIQQIVAISPQTNKNLDYSYYPHQPEDKYSSKFGYEVLGGDNVLELQRTAEKGEREWSFTDPQRVASEYFARTLKLNEKRITGIKQIRKYQGAVAYYWRNRATKTPYIVVISRPYWLSFYAKDKDKIAWVITEAYRIFEKEADIISASETDN